MPVVYVAAENVSSMNVARADHQCCPRIIKIMHVYVSSRFALQCLVHVDSFSGTRVMQYFLASVLQLQLAAIYLKF